VKIPIPELLVRLRRDFHARQAALKRLGFRLWCWGMGWTGLYRAGQKWMRRLLPHDDEEWVTHGPGPLADWTSCRDLPRPAARSFRQQWAEGLRDES